MTESRQRGLGHPHLTEQQINAQLGWMGEDRLIQEADNLRAELDRARRDFTTELPWNPNNRYHLSDWWEQLGKWYMLRARIEAKKAERLARVGAA